MWILIQTFNRSPSTMLPIQAAYFLYWVIERCRDVFPWLLFYAAMPLIMAGQCQPSLVGIAIRRSTEEVLKLSWLEPWSWDLLIDSLAFSEGALPDFFTYYKHQEFYPNQYTQYMLSRPWTKTDTINNTIIYCNGFDLKFTLFPFTFLFSCFCVHRL